MKNLICTLILFTSIHSSAQWTQVNTGISDLSQGAILLGHTSNYIFSGTLGGAKMYRSNDNGTNWNEIQPPVAMNIPVSAYYFNGNYFAGLNSSSNCIFYSGDDGSTWNPTTGSPVASVVRGFIHLQNNLYAFTSNSGIYKSTDGGLNWTQEVNGLSNLNVIRMETISSKLYAATIGGGIFISTNNGASWDSSSNGIATGDLNGENVWRMGSDLYYYAQGGVAYKSIDEGINWTSWSMPAEFGLGLNEIYRSGNNLYIESRHFTTGLRDSIYLSNDEGMNWQNITDNLDATNLNGFGITEHNAYAYIAYNIISPNEGIYRHGVSVGIESNQTENSSVSIYPNPAKDLITIQPGLSQTSGSFLLTDLCGKSLSGPVSFMGKMSYDIRALPCGVYFLRIISDKPQLIKLIKE
jgi:photosystem II stability/assembly factor-like uncharacterized protein